MTLVLRQKNIASVFNKTRSINENISKMYFDPEEEDQTSNVLQVIEEAKQRPHSS